MEMVDLYHGDTEREGESLGKVRPDKQRAQESRASCEGDGIEVLCGDASAADGFADDGDDVLLVGT